MASITIPLYYDLDLLLWTSAAGGIARQPNLVLGQSDSIAFAVQFVRSGVVIELTSPAWICGIKPINDVAGDYLCQTTTGVKTGSTTTTVYTFTLLLDSTELRAWLLTVTAVSNYAAFSIRDTVNLIATLPAITCTILPDYTLEGTTPTDANGTLIVSPGQTFTVSKTFAMPTDDGQNTYVLKTNGAGVGSWAADNAGTGTVTNVAVTTANGVSGSVATSTTTPAITLTLGAITPTTGAFSDETNATNATTAPLKTAGGLAVAKSLYVGEGIQVLGTGNRSTITDELLVGGELLVRYLTSYANETILDLSPIAGSVNNLAIEPSLTTLPVHIYAQGADANIGLHLQAKGAGFVNVQDGTDTTKRLRFSASGNSSAVITTLASSSTTSQTITLPNATGATTLAGLQMIQTFSAAQTFSSTVGLTLGTDATSSTAGGTLTVTGGAAVSKKLFVGTSIDLVATTSTAGQITQAGTQFIHSYGTDNLFLGGAGNATLANMSGSGLNVALGKLALGSATTTTGNVAIGKSSLGAITTSASFSNVALGNQCLDTTTSAIEVIAIGNNCQRSIVSQYSVTIGNLANAGQYSVSLGYNALNATTAAAIACVAIGRDAMKLATGERNTACGHSAGSTITTGTYNTLLGEQAQTGSATGTYRTAIGSGATANINNSIKLGRDILDVVVLPKMTTAQRGTYGTPVGGALIFNTSTGKLNFWNSTAGTPAWEEVTSI